MWPAVSRPLPGQAQVTVKDQEQVPGAPALQVGSSAVARAQQQHRQERLEDALHSVALSAIGLCVQWDCASVGCAA